MITDNDRENYGFNISAVIENFEKSRLENDDVGLLPYVQAYEELSKLFSILGVIFSFVEVDVKGKRGILRVLYEKDPENYASVKNMVAYEFPDSNMPKGQGSRTLLRMVPNRQVLIKEIFANHTKDPTPEHIQELSSHFLEVVNDVYERIQTLYEEKNLLSLP